MNKLEQLQNQYGVKNVFLVSSWEAGISKFFRYYVTTTKEFHNGGSTNLNTERMECRSVLEGVESGEINQEELRTALIELHKGFWSYKNAADNWPNNFGNYLINNWRFYSNFQFNMPVMLKDRTNQVNLLRAFKDYKTHKVMVEVEDAEGSWVVKASQVLNLVGGENIAKEYQTWRDFKIESATLKELCNQVDTRVVKFVKNTLCKQSSYYYID